MAGGRDAGGGRAGLAGHGLAVGRPPVPGGGAVQPGLGGGAAGGKCFKKLHPKVRNHREGPY